MTVRTGGELLVSCLEAQGVTTVFGVPGESYLAVLDGLHDSDIAFIGARQEGGASYAASAWGKLTGEPGIAMVTRGPGATNASVGIHTAMQDSSPLVMFVGQASTDHLGREAFQEIDYRAFFAPIAKWATQIDHVDRIPEIVSRAFATAQSGRPGPVVVALPEDVLSATTSVRPGARVRVARPAPSATEVADLLAMLDQAERPLVVVAGSAWDAAASDALGTFAESNDVPVAAVFRYLDVIDNHSPAYIGEAGVGMKPHVRTAIEQADVVVGLGVRFGEMTTGAYTLFSMPDAAQRIVHVHASSDELGKVVQAELPIQADAQAVAVALGEASLTASVGRRTWARDLRAQHELALVAPPQPGELDMGEVTAWLQDRLPPDTIVTNGAGNFAIWPNKHFSFGPDARLLAPQSGSMGYGLPAAIAARLAHPDRTVVCFAGDGDLQMNIQELGMARQHGAQPIVLVLNNEMYGTIRMHQERTFPERVSGTDIVNPDYVAIGSAYGFLAERVTSTSAFADAFERALASPTGALLELVVPPQMLSPTLSIDDARSGS